MHLPRLALALGVGVAPLLLPGSSPEAPVVAIVDANLVTMDQPGVTADQTVLVHGGRITWIGPAARAVIPRGAQRIDARGLYLVPGLVDMHVHCDSTDMPLFIANGVTTIREMNGSARHLVWRDRVARDPSLPLPSLYVASTLLAGTPLQWRHLLVTTPAEGAAAAREAIYDGYDFIKVYSGLTRETYDTIVAIAHRAGVPVVGHIARDVGLEHALESGQVDIAHVEQIMDAVAGHDPDTAAIAPAVAAIRQAGAWVEPTLAVMEVLMQQGTPWFDSLYSRPEMRYVDAGTLGWWRSLRRPSRDGRAGGSVIGANRLAWMRLLTRRLYDAGVPLLVGTDEPNPLMVPGFSLHDEMEALVRVGIPPADVLRAATRGAATFVSRADVFGTIKVGARADLVLVNGDPLSDLARLRHPQAVMLRGRWYDAAGLRRMLEEAGRTIRGS